jgi:DNA repair ATPase RecN
MDDLLRQLEQETEEIMRSLPDVPFEQLAEFVEIRERYLQKIAEYPDAAREMIHYHTRVKHLLGYDTKIVARMSALRDEAQAMLQKANQAKKQRTLYDSEYDYESPGIFMDNRK